ncbi:type I-C CRISPR-associated protein Cas8c/Csd1 [Halomonas sp. KAO]|uniref:type I-C CRISPR-associated protein Cas8c/Csd1 n=1 Tax=Halomonas sp. KAO TaxID=2783858 RepID=UPI00189FE5FC|nr:type I-C CRISPR-associated protein Cas8c/Csd1 [Halomonas sp. KAO]MBF7054568.1 type I-C CRISPR-associated protein Cas8c/Csd1 [Halomonas sp. KAO]
MMLSALNDYYHRLAVQGKVPAPGFSSEKVSFALILSADGQPIEIADLRDTTGKKPRPVLMQVPIDKSRTSGIHAYPLWDKTAYAFGVTKGAGKRLADEHAAFKERQLELFGDSDDPDLRAFLRLMEQWQPERLKTLPGYSDEALDANFVFRIDGQHAYLHEKTAVRDIWREVMEKDDGAHGQCLVTGETGPLAPGHPRIREVNGAQSSGAALISFNSDAYESYSKGGMANASISKAAVFGYATALNHILRRDAHNHQRLQIGDATVVFWARAQDTVHAEAAEGLFALLNNPPTDEQEAARLKTVLEGVAMGRPLASLDPELDGSTEFFVLGLAPNAARLSIRFWCVNDLDHLVRHYVDHRRDLALEPSPWKGVAPSSSWLTKQTAPIRKKDGKPSAEDVPPQLAGELMRSIITGCRYPRALLNNIVMRFRSDGQVTGPRVALCKAVLAREARLAAHMTSSTQEVPVSLDPHSTHQGYLLGRLFAELENAQRSALGKELNATIRDRYYGAASATPASVFPMLLRNVQHHLSNMRKKEKGGLAHKIESEIGAIIDGLGESFPKSLRIEDQGRFAIGYYHQSQARFATKDGAANNAEDEQGESK